MYRKRHQLATPSSLDQDFNFITRVERTIQRAGDEAQERGIPLSEDSRKRVKGEGRRDAEIQQRAAIVLKAPAGMSRALQNKSKWDNRHKCLLWTVEWILENEAKVLGNCQETRTVAEAFANAVPKRKMQLLSAPDLDSWSVSEGRKKNPSNSTARAESTSYAEHHFYLHRPNLPSNLKCVIPVQPDAMIKDVIRDRALVEFPTIFVLNASKEKLQRPFITEKAYIERQGNGPPTTGSEIPNERFATDGNDKDLNDLQSPSKLDGEKIEEVLQNNLGT